MMEGEDGGERWSASHNKGHEMKANSQYAMHTACL